MNRKVFNILTKIPVVGLVTYIIYRPYLFSSVGMDEGVYDDLLEYMHKHPDVLMTNKLAGKIRRGEIK